MPDKLLLATLIDRLPPFDPQQGVEHTTRWFGWFFDLLAQAIEARRAETHSGSVHESAVPQECAQPGQSS